MKASQTRECFIVDSAMRGGGLHFRRLFLLSYFSSKASEFVKHFSTTKGVREDGYVAPLNTKITKPR